MTWIRIQVHLGGAPRMSPKGAGVHDGEGVEALRKIGGAVARDYVGKQFAASGEKDAPTGDDSPRRAAHLGAEAAVQLDSGRGTFVNAGPSERVRLVW